MRCVLSWCVHYFFVTAYQFLEASPPHPVSSPPWRECRIRRTYSNCFNCFLILSVTDSHAGVFFVVRFVLKLNLLDSLDAITPSIVGEVMALGNFPPAAGIPSQTVYVASEVA